MKRQHDAGQRTVRRPTPEATARVGVTLVIPAVLRSLGADPAEVLAESGFDPKFFDDPDNRISLATRDRLVARCAARTGCAHFGLLVGQQGGLHSLGVLGLLVKYSPNVRAALQSLVRYLHLQVRGDVLTLAVDGDLAMLSYAPCQTEHGVADQVGDSALAVAFNIMRDLCGQEWKPIEVRFVHRKPRDVMPFRRFFSAPLRFNAEQYSLVFSGAWLSHPLPETNVAPHRMLQKQVDTIEARDGKDFVEQVRGVLRSALITGQGKAGQVAALFSMPSYTLARRLEESGVGFHTLVDETRFEIAQQMLETSDMDVSTIAASLDYANASAFTRAFRRWSGTTPAQWRATHGAAS